MDLNSYYNLIFAVLTGAAIGIEREYETRKDKKQDNSLSQHRKSFGGARTFPLASILGFLGVLFHQKGFTWIFPVTMLVIGFLILVSHYKEKDSIGITTEISFLVTYFIGALCALNEVFASAFIMVITVTLLSLKPV